MPKSPPASASAESAPQSEEELQKLIAKRYDQLNALWTKAEESLRKFLVPEAICHRYDTDMDDFGNETRYFISWEKCNGTWRLCFDAVDTRDPDPGCGKPVTECSVEIRLELVQHFPALREKVIEAARKNVQTLDKAISDMSAYLK